MADEQRFHPLVAEYAMDADGKRVKTGMGPLTGVAVTKHDYRTRKGYLADIFGNDDATLEEHGVKLLDPETGKVMTFDESKAEAKDEKKKGE